MYMYMSMYMYTHAHVFIHLYTYAGKHIFLHSTHSLHRRRDRTCIGWPRLAANRFQAKLFCEEYQFDAAAAGCDFEIL